MSAFTQEQLLELAAGYALGGLTSDEHAAVEAALPGNAALAAEVRAIQDTMVRMERASAPVAPRAELREAWLQRAQAIAREPQPAVTPSATVRPIESAPSARASGAQWLYRAAIAASLIAVFALNRELQRTRAELATATAAEAKRERQLNTLLEAEGRLLLAVLEPTQRSSVGVQFFWNVRQQRGIIHAFHLPPAPEGRAYQLWAIRGATPISVRVFNSDRDGHALVEGLSLPNSPEGVTTIAITVEPAGGSPQPTTTPILAGTLRQQSGA